MNVLRTSLVLVTASTLAGIVAGAPYLNRTLEPEPGPVTVLPPTVASGAARAVVAEARPELHLEMASLQLYGPPVDLTEEETLSMVRRWRELQARSIADPVLPASGPDIAERDLHRPSFEQHRRAAPKVPDHYHERGYYAQSRFAQRGGVRAGRTPNGGQTIFSQSRWARDHSSNYQRIGNRYVRRTNKRTTRYY